jgi:hypothetical protein
MKGEAEEAARDFMRGPEQSQLGKYCSGSALLHRGLSVGETGVGRAQVLGREQAVGIREFVLFQVSRFFPTVPAAYSKQYSSIQMHGLHASTASDSEWKGSL